MKGQHMRLSNTFGLIGTFLKVKLLVAAHLNLIVLSFRMDVYH